MRVDKMRNIIGCVVLALLTGCAGSPKVPAVAHTGEPVCIVIRIAGSENTAFDVDSKGKRAARGAIFGTLEGTAAGGAAFFASVAALGAAAPIGLFLLFPAGALAGATGGTIHGLRGLSKDEAGRVNAALSELDARRDVRADLVAALGRELAPEMRSVADCDGCAECANVSVSILRFSPEQHGKKQLSLRLKTEMRIESEDEHQGKKAVLDVRNESESKQRDVRKWLAEGDTAFDEAVIACIDDAARKMREDLRKRLQR